MDDIGIPTYASGTWDEDFERHCHTVEEFLRRCRDQKIFLSRKKAQILRPRIEFLGHEITPGMGFRVKNETAENILSIPPPADRKALRKVIGMFTWVSTSIPQYAERSAPLRATLTLAERLDTSHSRGGKRPSSTLFPLSGAALLAFEDLRDEMTSPRVLSPFQQGVESILVSDASQ